jgi:hypothetical protein
MTKTMTIKNEYNSLETLYNRLKKEATNGCYIDFDIWDFRLDTNGQLEECLVLKKSSMHAIKVYFTEGNTAKLSYIIPNKIMNSYFGKSKRIRQNIIELMSEKLKQTILAGSQQKAFDELETIVRKAAS